MSSPPIDSATVDPLISEVAGTPLELFDRWERQPWSIAELTLTDDRDGWAGLGQIKREMLRAAIESFLVGESAVTDTLSPLIQGAPTPEEQLFLSTQLADEARHTLFFARYLQSMDEQTAPLTLRFTASDALSDVLDDPLREATGRVRQDPQDRAAWYRSLVIYHLLVEGVLAVSGTRSLLSALRRIPELGVLITALTNIARDESRHIVFGVGALRIGVNEGHAATVTQALAEFSPLAARALIKPAKRYPALAPSDVQARLGADLERIWGLAEKALLGRAQRIGLDSDACEFVQGAWDQGREGALDEYQQLHDAAHPVRRVQGGRLAASPPA
jgi:ribonucleoside-diphosphate reductase beta chain